MKSNNLECINHFFAQIMDIFPITYSYISTDVPSGFMARFPAFIFLVLIHTLSLFLHFLSLSLSLSCSLYAERDLLLQGKAVSKVQSH